MTVAGGSGRQSRRGRHVWAVLAALLLPAAGEAQPIAVEPGWQAVRTDLLADPQAARINPKDGHLYVAVIVDAASGGGVYRIEAGGGLTLIASSERPRGIAIDPDDGDVFHSEAGFPGEIYRTAFGATGRETWVSGLHSGDDDPIGLAIAPDGHTGPWVAPGEALLADEGNGGPRELWRWSPDVQQLQSVVHAEDGSLLKPVDVAIGRDDVWVADQAGGALAHLEDDGSVSLLVTSLPTPSPRAVAVDPKTQELLVLEQVNEQLLRIDPQTGTVSRVLSGLSLIPQSETSGLEATADGAELIVTDRGAGTVTTWSRLPAAAPGLTCGTTVPLGFAAAGDTPVLRFPARAGDVVAVASAPLAGGAPSPRAVLFAPDGRRVSLGDEWVGCPGLCPSAPLPADGFYRLWLFDSGHDATGGFRLTVEALSGALGGASNGPLDPICIGADGTRTLFCGAPATGSLDGEADTDSWTFFGEVGEELRLSVGESGGSGVVPLLQLFGPGGVPVTLNGSLAPCTGVCDTPPLPAFGAYTALVYDGLLAASGAYDLALEQLAGGLPVACSSACSNGLDDDGDGQIDSPADAGCSTPDDFSERAACDDGVDNDGDGLADGLDPGCQNSASPREDPACDDGHDNDGDGFFDWDGAGLAAADPECVGKPWRNSEAKTGSCGLGFEVAPLLPALMALRRRRRRA